ncbi:SpoIIE family protein phosphatase [Streptomyces sp. NPDC004647]|uniref:SpoIIE family protein phosphatase n=1 Tax=Streptomyces sp. NPDC004647 TaxID=3154671 RepID=UPI0033ABEDAC
MADRGTYPATTATLLMFTDGLVEQPGKGLDDGLRLLTQALTGGPHHVEELADHLGTAMGERTGGDDMAMLLLRREGFAVPEVRRRIQQRIVPTDPQGLARARHTISEAVRSWAVRGRAEEVELVADELITNALLHTDGGAVVTVRMLGARSPG